MAELTPEIPQPQPLPITKTKLTGLDDSSKSQDSQETQQFESSPQMTQSVWGRLMPTDIKFHVLELTGMFFTKINVYICCIYYFVFIFYRS